MATNLVTDPLRPTLIKLTLPMMFGMISLMLFNLVDIYFVAQLGSEQMAALAFTLPVTFSVVSLAIGLGVGTSATLARCLGSGDEQQAAQIASDNLLVTAALIILLSSLMALVADTLFSWMGAEGELLSFTLEYMHIWWLGAPFLVLNMVSNSTFRARGDTRTPALIMSASSLLNMLLDPLLIFGLGPIPAMGIQGAALASVIAWALASLVVYYLLRRRFKLLTFSALSLPRVVANSLSVLRIGLPAALSNMMTPLAGAVLTSVVATHGHHAVAAFGVGNRIESLSLLVCLALSMTLPPLISQNFGAGQIQRVSSAYRGALIFALLWQLVIYFILQLGSGFIITTFADSAAVEGPLLLWLLLVPAGFGLQAVTFLSASSFNALHRPMRALSISLVRLFVFYVPLALLGNHWFGLNGMFAAFVLANACTACVAFLSMRQLLTSLKAAADTPPKSQSL